MEVKDYQEQYKSLVKRQEELNNERKALNKKFAEEHPWNAYKDKKVVVKIKDVGTSTPFFLDHIEADDYTVACCVGYKVKKDGSKSLQVNRVYFTFDHEIEEVE